MYELMFNYNRVAEAEKKSDFAQIVFEWLLLKPANTTYGGEVIIQIKEIEVKKEEEKV